MTRFSRIFLFLLLLGAGPANAFEVLDNDLLRFGTGTEASVNTSGNLQQPFYFDPNISGGTFAKLTFSNFPLDNAIGIDGDGTNNWNINGTIQENSVLTGQVLDVSGFTITSGSKGTGTIVSTGTVTIAAKTLQVRNTYELLPGKSFIKIVTRVTNTSGGPVSNLRYWVGTRDDFVGLSDSPTKERGNLVDGAFEILANAADQSAALRITTATSGVLFFSTSPKANTSIEFCCSFSNAYGQDPATSAITQPADDGSYALFIRMTDLADGESEEFTWFYAAGEVGNLDAIIGDVAAASGAVSDIGYTTATFKATTSADSTGYWMVVARDATAPTEAQIKAGADYGAVTVVASGSGAMTAAVEKAFALGGLQGGTNYDLYFVAEDAVPAFSSIVKAQFATLPYAAPTVDSTTAITAITGTGAASGGNVSDDGSDGDRPVTARGVCWNTTGTPTTADTCTSDGTGTGTFTSTLTGLAPATTHYVRAYATNAVGTAYGPERSFDTLAADTTPDAFSFTAQTGAALSTVATANSITVAGINSVANITIVGGTYSINGGAYTAVAGTVNNGDTVIVQQTSSASYSTLTTATLTIGGVTGAFDVTTLAQDTGYTAPSATGTGDITASFTGGGAGCGYDVSQFIPLTGHTASPPAGTAPAGFTFPHGLFDFTVSTCTPGSTITMVITYPQALPSNTVYWKYGPTPTDGSYHWYQLPATIAGKTATFSITDGGLGDDDLAANGTIVDQGGPGMPAEAASIPTLSEWALLMLVGLMGLFGMGAMRRRAPL